MGPSPEPVVYPTMPHPLCFPLSTAFKLLLFPLFPQLVSPKSALTTNR